LSQNQKLANHSCWLAWLYDSSNHFFFQNSREL